LHPEFRNLPFTRRQVTAWLRQRRPNRDSTQEWLESKTERRRLDVKSFSVIVNKYMILLYF